jgi:predicted acetyltransferase
VIVRPPVVRPVADDQWPVVAWLWQDFRHDLASVVNGFPYADGRYRHEWLDEYPGPGRAGYLAWTPHPNTGEDSPVAFGLVKGLDGPRQEFAALFVVPAARRSGLGGSLALDVIGRHPGAWGVGFQHDNPDAGRFWRGVASKAWGEAWTETEEPVPGKPEVAPDHWIRTE